MKEVIIKSKIVGKESAIGSGKPIAFPDLSAYALRSDFIRLESSFNDFLEGDDTDNVINRWKELEAFLNNISEDYNLLSLLNGKADKATTLSGYGITDAYTKTNVDDLLKYYVTLGGTPQTITGEKNFTGGLKVNGSPIYYDTEKKYWKLEGDLLVTGGVTMYGSDSSFVPSTIMDAIAVDGTTISKSGGVLKVIGGTGGGVADSVAWANITGKPTWIGSTKPSYSYSEITGAISTTELQNYLTSNSYLNATSGDNRYLKLSGGTLTGNILLGGTTTNKIGTNIVDTTSWQEFTHQNSHGYIALGPFNDSVAHIYTDRPTFYFNKELYVNGSKVWNAGNDGSGSTLDADLLDGNHLSDILASNVASATKLETARTIWGQPFDGTGNVFGQLYLNTSKIVWQNDVNNYYIGCPTVTGGARLEYRAYSGHAFLGGNVGIGTESPQQKLHVEGNIWANGDIAAKTKIHSFGNLIVNGNVGIGTENPSATFHAIGTIYKTCIFDSTYTAYGYNYGSIHLSLNGESKGVIGVNTVPSSKGSSNTAGTYIENVVSGEWMNFYNEGGVFLKANLLVNGGITMYSQRSLKNIVDERGLSLSELSVIKPTRYTWKDGRDNRLHFGGIADDIQQVLPEVVYQTSDGILTMDYGNAAFAVASSLIQPVVNHEKRIAMLQERIVELEEEVERLKSA